MGQRYFCLNCHHRFEAEEKDNLECPRCLWTTSVKKEEEIVQDRPARVGETKPTGEREMSVLARLRPVKFKNGTKLLLILILAALTAGVIGLLVWPATSSFLQGFREGPSKRATNKPREIAVSLEKKSESEPGSQVEGLAALSEPEKRTLYREIKITADRELVASEQKVLDDYVPFKTGLVERLPSQPWRLEDFREFIKEQERFYKMPLPHSYKKDLEKLFQQTYVPATEAFKKGDLLEARNLWVQSLVIPVYQNNLKKHRGVVLTMLKPFINDTLSKIGALTTSLAERPIREKEQAITTAYQEVHNALKKRDWHEALEAVRRFQEIVHELEEAAANPPPIPPYPPQIRNVDRDVQATLYELLAPSPVSLANLGPLKADVKAKERIAKSFLEEYLGPVRQQYHHALELIREKNWRTAREEFEKIDFPYAVVQDAKQKVKILKKLEETSP